MKRILPILAILVVATAASAQGPMGAGRGPGPMAGPGSHGPGLGTQEFREQLLAPQLLLRNQIALNLSDAQVDSIKKLIQESHSKTIDLRTDLQKVTERLGTIVAATKVDEAAALAASDEAMALESQIKKAHFALLIRVKNLLTAEQIQKAKALRAE
jgi:Spy/CpxP family protein refolding chaperone